MNNKRKIKVIKDGPYSVSGSVPLKEEEIVNDKDGFPLKWKVNKKYPDKKDYLLCRCGQSKTKPYCDQSHVGKSTNCRETANNAPFDSQAEAIDGPELTLKDAPLFCVHAGFCDRAGGIWDLTKQSRNLKAKKTAIEEAANCPSGRLVVINKKTKKAIEPEFDQSISATKDDEGIAGPLWVKGGIPVESADGRVYENRNRVTLCRCGLSQNKPFCDGSHYRVREDKNDPIDNLVIEHVLISLMLRILEKMDGSRDLDDAVTFLREFADKCHHGKEEDLLFPMMKEQASPRIAELIRVLLAEHEEARGYIKNLKADFSLNSQKYIELLKQHILKENITLFPEAKHTLSLSQMEELAEGFEDVEINKIGLNRHEELHQIIDKLKEKYL